MDNFEKLLNYSLAVFSLISLSLTFMTRNSKIKLFNFYPIKTDKVGIRYLRQHLTSEIALLK